MNVLEIMGCVSGALLCISLNLLVKFFIASMFGCAWLAALGVAYFGCCTWLFLIAGMMDDGDE